MTARDPQGNPSVGTPPTVLQLVLALRTSRPATYAYAVISADARGAEVEPCDD